MPIPGDILKLDSTDNAKLGGITNELIQDLETENEPFISGTEFWWKWYESTPEARIKSRPWPGASNIVVPIIRTSADALIARFFNTVRATDKTWIGTTENEDLKDIVDIVIDHLNTSARRDFDVFFPMLDWITEMVILGRSVLTLRWEDRERFILVPGGGKKPKRIRMSSGPVVEHVPAEDMLWQTGTTIDRSEVVARGSWLTWTDLTRAAQVNDYDKEAVEEAQHQGIPPESAALRVREHRAMTEGRDPNSTLRELHRVYDVWMDFPTIKAAGFESIVKPEDKDVDLESVEIIVTMHRGSGKVLRAVANPYLFGHKPFYDIYFKKRTTPWGSPGVAQILEHVQRGVSTLVNMTIDGIAFNNSMKLITTSDKLVDFQFSPQRPIVVDQGPTGKVSDVVQVANTGQSIIPDVTMINLLTAFGERVTGINDPGLGRETRMGGHPSPATSTLTMLQQSAIPIATTMKIIRHQLNRLGEDVLMLFQQFESRLDDSKLVARFGGPDAAQLQLFLSTPIPGNIVVDVRAMSEIHNPEARRQGALLNFQVLNNYYSTLMKIAEAIDLHQSPNVKTVGMKAVEGFAEMFRVFLESGDVDDPDALVFKLEELQQQTQGALDGAEQLGREVVAGAGQPANGGANPRPVRGGPVGNLRGRPGGGAPGGGRGAGDLL